MSFKPETKSRNLTGYVYIACSLLFFMQAFGLMDSIPVGFFTTLFGISRDPLSIAFAMFYAIFFIFVASAVIEVLYSFGFKRNTKFFSSDKVFAQGSKVFLSIWVALFSYGILAALSIVPSIPDPADFVSFYIGWYIIIVRPFAGMLATTGRKLETVDRSESDVDVRRVTWWKNLFAPVPQFTGEKGAVVFKQGYGMKVFLAVVLSIVMTVAYPFIYAFSVIVFVDTNIEPASAIRFVQIVAAFFLVAIGSSLFVALGSILSTRYILYQNCIHLPLATLSDKPLFTALLPKSSVVLGFSEVASYSIQRKKYKNKNDTFISLVTITLRDGSVFVLDATLPDQFEDGLKALLPDKA